MSCDPPEGSLAQGSLGLLPSPPENEKGKPFRQSPHAPHCVQGPLHLLVSRDKSHNRVPLLINTVEMALDPESGYLSFTPLWWKPWADPGPTLSLFSLLENKILKTWGTLL